VATGISDFVPAGRGNVGRGGTGPGGWVFFPGWGQLAPDVLSLVHSAKGGENGKGAGNISRRFFRAVGGPRVPQGAPGGIGAPPQRSASFGQKGLFDEQYREFW